MLWGHLFVQIHLISHVLDASVNQARWKGHDTVFPRSADLKRRCRRRRSLCDAFASISCRLFESVSVAFPRQERETVWRTFLTSLTCSLLAKRLDSHNVDPVGTSYSCGRCISGSGSHLIAHNKETSTIVPELTLKVWMLHFMSMSKTNFFSRVHCHVVWDAFLRMIFVMFQEKCICQMQNIHEWTFIGFQGSKL